MFSCRKIEVQSWLRNALPPGALDFRIRSSNPALLDVRTLRSRSDTAYECASVARRPLWILNRPGPAARRMGGGSRFARAPPDRRGTVHAYLCKPQFWLTTIFRGSSLARI
jgi:hypothetical protein